jgi:hypothetical protein
MPREALSADRTAAVAHPTLIRRRYATSWPIRSVGTPPQGRLWRVVFEHEVRVKDIEMSATPGLSRECRFGKSDKLFQPFVTMKVAGLSFDLSI